MRLEKAHEQLAHFFSLCARLPLLLERGVQEVESARLDSEGCLVFFSERAEEQRLLQSPSSPARARASPRQKLQVLTGETAGAVSEGGTCPKDDSDIEFLHIPPALRLWTRSARECLWPLVVKPLLYKRAFQELSRVLQRRARESFPQTFWGFVHASAGCGSANCSKEGDGRRAVKTASGSRRGAPGGSGGKDESVVESPEQEPLEGDGVGASEEMTRRLKEGAAKVLVETCLALELLSVLAGHREPTDTSSDEDCGDLSPPSSKEANPLKLANAFQHRVFTDAWRSYLDAVKFRLEEGASTAAAALVEGLIRRGLVHFARSLTLAASGVVVVSEAARQREAENSLSSSASSFGNLSSTPSLRPTSSSSSCQTAGPPSPSTEEASSLLRRALVFVRPCVGPLSSLEGGDAAASAAFAASCVEKALLAETRILRGEGETKTAEPGVRVLRALLVAQSLRRQRVEDEGLREQLGVGDLAEFCLEGEAAARALNAGLSDRGSVLLGEFEEEGRETPHRKKRRRAEPKRSPRSQFECQAEQLPSSGAASTQNKKATNALRPTPATEARPSAGEKKENAFASPRLPAARLLGSALQLLKAMAPPPSSPPGFASAAPPSNEKEAFLQEDLSSASSARIRRTRVVSGEPARSLPLEALALFLYGIPDTRSSPPKDGLSSIARAEPRARPKRRSSVRGASAAQFDPQERPFPTNLRCLPASLAWLAVLADAFSRVGLSAFWRRCAFGVCKEALLKTARLTVRFPEEALVGCLSQLQWIVLPFLRVVWGGAGGEHQALALKERDLEEEGASSSGGEGFSARARRGGRRCGVYGRLQPSLPWEGLIFFPSKKGARSCLMPASVTLLGSGASAWGGAGAEADAEVGECEAALLRAVASAVHRRRLAQLLDLIQLYPLSAGALADLRLSQGLLRCAFLDARRNVLALIGQTLWKTPGEKSVLHALGWQLRRKAKGTGASAETPSLVSAVRLAVRVVALLPALPLSPSEGLRLLAPLVRLVQNHAEGRAALCASLPALFRDCRRTQRFLRRRGRKSQPGEDGEDPCVNCICSPSPLMTTNPRRPDSTLPPAGGEAQLAAECSKAAARRRETRSGAESQAVERTLAFCVEVFGGPKALAEAFEQSLAESLLSTSWFEKAEALEKKRAAQRKTRGQATPHPSSSPFDSEERGAADGGTHLRKRALAAESAFARDGEEARLVETMRWVAGRDRLTVEALAASRTAQEERELWTDSSSDESTTGAAASPGLGVSFRLPKLRALKSVYDSTALLFENLRDARLAHCFIMIQDAERSFLASRLARCRAWPRRSRQEATESCAETAHEKVQEKVQENQAEREAFLRKVLSETSPEIRWRCNSPLTPTPVFEEATSESSLSFSQMSMFLPSQRGASASHIPSSPKSSPQSRRRRSSAEVCTAAVCGAKDALLTCSARDSPPLRLSLVAASRGAWPNARCGVASGEEASSVRSDAELFASERLPKALADPLSRCREAFACSTQGRWTLEVRQAQSSVLVRLPDRRLKWLSLSEAVFLLALSEVWQAASAARDSQGTAVLSPRDRRSDDAPPPWSLSAKELAERVGTSERIATAALEGLVARQCAAKGRRRGLATTSRDSLKRSGEAVFFLLASEKSNDHPHHRRDLAAAAEADDGSLASEASPSTRRRRAAATRLRAADAGKEASKDSPEVAGLCTPQRGSLRRRCAQRTPARESQLNALSPRGDPFASPQSDDGEGEEEPEREGSFAQMQLHSERRKAAAPSFASGADLCLSDEPQAIVQKTRRRPTLESATEAAGVDSLGEEFSRSNSRLPTEDAAGGEEDGGAQAAREVGAEDASALQDFEGAVLSILRERAARVAPAVRATPTLLVLKKLQEWERRRGEADGGARSVRVWTQTALLEALQAMEGKGLVNKVCGNWQEAD